MTMVINEVMVVQIVVILMGWVHVIVVKRSNIVVISKDGI